MENPERKICATCGHIAEPLRVDPGSLTIQIILIFCAVIPGIFYSLWRHSSIYECCPQCKSREIVPLDTPRGIQLKDSLHGKTLEREMIPDAVHLQQLVKKFKAQQSGAASQAATK